MKKWAAWVGSMGGAKIGTYQTNVQKRKVKTTMYDPEVIGAY